MLLGQMFETHFEHCGCLWIGSVALSRRVPPKLPFFLTSLPVCPVPLANGSSSGPDPVVICAARVGLGDACTGTGGLLQNTACG